MDKEDVAPYCEECGNDISGQEKLYRLAMKPDSMNLCFACKEWWLNHAPDAIVSEVEGG